MKLGSYTSQRPLRTSPHRTLLPQEMAELDSKIQQCQDFQEALSMLQTRHDITVSRNATRQVQLVAAYGAQELEVGLEELEQWQADLEPRLAETAALIDRLGYDIRVSQQRAATTGSLS